MRSFVKLIFILVFCFKFVVPEPYAPVGQRQRANNTRDWPAEENSRGTSDRRYQNLNTQPRENSLKDYGSHQETTNLLHQQRNNRNIEENDNPELRHKQPLLSRNERYRNERNRKNPSWPINDFDMLPSRPGRNLATRSDQMNSELNNRNSGSNNNYKPSNLDRRQHKFDENFETLNYENDTPVNIMDIGKTLNKYKRANDREENSARLLQTNPLRIQDETYNLPNYKAQHNTPLEEEYEIFDSGNEKQYKSRPKVQQSFSRLSHKIEPDTANIRNYNIEEERFGVSDRPLSNEEEIIERNQAKRRLDSLNKGNWALQSDQDFSNEYRTPVRIATPISYDEPFNTDGDNTKSDYTIPKDKQVSLLETPNKPKVQVQEVRRPLEISQYDNSGNAPPIQHKHHTKSILYNGENSDSKNLNSGYTAHKMSPTHSYVTSDLSRVTEKTEHHLLKKEQKMQNNPSKPSERITNLNEPSNLSEENISDEYYPDISSSYDKGSSSSGTASLISERSKNRNIESLSVERSNDNSRNIKRITAADPIISESDDKGSSDVKEETLNQAYNKRQDLRPKTNKMSTIVKDSNSESPVYLDYSNEYEVLETSQNDQFSSKLSNNKVSNNGNGRRIEIDINYLQSPKYDSSENKQTLDSVESKIFTDEKPTKLLTTFTQGQDGIDLKIENDNFEVPAAVPPLIKLINRKEGQRHFDDKTIDVNQEGRSPNFNKKEKPQKHVIPIILNNDNEKRTFNLNENVPLTVDFSGPIEEIDINYHIGEEIPFTKAPREYTDKSKRKTVTKTDFSSGDASNGEQETDKNDAKELTKSTKNSQSKTEIGQKSSGHKNNVKHGSDHPVQDTKIDSQEFKENDKEVTTSKIYDGPVSETSSSTNTNNTNSGEGITSLFSNFLNLFSNLGSSEDTVAKSDQVTSNERKIHKKRGHSHRHHSRKHRVRSDLGDDEIITLSPIEVPQQLTYNDSLITENDSTSKVGSVSKRGHSHGKKKKHRRSGSHSNINQANLPVPDQDNARAGDEQDNQEIRHIRKDSSQKHNSGSNFDNDEIVTLSPIEVPQKPSNGTLMETSGPINKRGHRRIKKTIRRRSGGGDSHDQENLQRNDQYDARDNREFDLSRIVAKSKPVLWYPGNGDEFANVKDERNVPNVMYIFEIENRPIVERDTKTTILSNGTMIKEYTETTYKDKEDKEPTIFRTTKVIHPDEPTDDYPF